MEYTKLQSTKDLLKFKSCFVKIKSSDIYVNGNTTINDKYDEIFAYIRMTDMNYWLASRLIRKTESSCSCYLIYKGDLTPLVEIRYVTSQEKELIETQIKEGTHKFEYYEIYEMAYNR